MIIYKTSATKERETRKETYDFGSVFDAFHDSAVADDLENAPVWQTFVQSIVGAVEWLNIFARILQISVQSLSKAININRGQQHVKESPANNLRHKRDWELRAN